MRRYHLLPTYWNFSPVTITKRAHVDVDQIAQASGGDFSTVVAQNLSSVNVSQNG